MPAVQIARTSTNEAKRVLATGEIRTATAVGGVVQSRTTTTQFQQLATNLQADEIDDEIRSHIVVVVDMDAKANAQH